MVRDSRDAISALIVRGVCPVLPDKELWGAESFSLRDYSASFFSSP